MFLQGEIELKDVVFSYPKTPDKIALDGVNLKIAKHSKVALVGDSGAGKRFVPHFPFISTFQRLVTLLSPAVQFYT
jgi:ABC-type multidrug transport system fused ATPase/permease subunit